MKKKGQAAMEFLMTYGWAILAAIIVIGVIAIYFRPGAVTTESAIVSPPFYAVASDVAVGAIDIEIENNGGETIEVCAVAVTSCITLGDATCTTSLDASVPSGEKIEEGGDTILDFTCAGIASGDTISDDVTITYKRTGSDILLTSTGTVSGKA